MKEKIIEEEIERVNRAMTQEGMPLTDDEKNDLKEVISGQKTYEEKRQEIIQETRIENGEINNGEIRKL